MYFGDQSSITTEEASVLAIVTRTQEGVLLSPTASHTCDMWLSDPSPPKKK